MSTDARPYEVCGKHVSVSGWACDKCGRFYGVEEHAARWCCATSLPCSTDGCAQRVEKGYTACRSCRARHDAERFAKRPRVAWDGETPLVLDGDDRYFFHAEDVGDYLAELPPAERAEARLQVCRPTRTPEFVMSEFLQDALPEDGADIDAREVERAVNEWIAKNGPFAWESSGCVPTLESLERVFGKLEEMT